LVDKHSHLRHLNRVEKTGQQLCGMKGAVERIFRQNILIGWESLFSVKGEAVNQIAQIVKSPAFVLQIFNILVLEDFGHKLREAVKKKNGHFTVRLTVRGGGGGGVSPP